MDIIGPLRPSNNCRYTFTIKDLLTKYVVVQPIANKEAKTIAETLVK